MTLPQKVAALCLLGAVLATAVSAAADAQQSVDAPESFQAGISSYYGAADVKHLCLRETKKYNCRAVGCRHQTCQPKACTDCSAHTVYQSDVSCCEHKGNYYDAESTPDAPEAVLNVGTCDWDFDIYKCDSTSASASTNADPECRDPIPMENGAFKVGTAWGNCFLDTDSDKCGHPFCNKMVLSFQGGFYIMHAYARSDYTIPEIEGCLSLNGTDEAHARSSFGGSERRLPSALGKAIEKSGLRKKLQAMHHAATSRGASAKHSQASNSTVQWELGMAGIMSGTITVTSLERRVEYTRGLMEYVAMWEEAAPLEDAVPGKTALVVQPFTYDIVMVEEGKEY